MIITISDIKTQWSQHIHCSILGKGKKADSNQNRYFSNTIEDHVGIKRTKETCHSWVEPFPIEFLLCAMYCTSSRDIVVDRTKSFTEKEKSPWNFVQKTFIGQCA